MSYSLVKNLDTWDLPLVGLAVSRCFVDAAFGIQFFVPDAEFELRIESTFLLRNADDLVLSMDPEKPSTLGPALVLFKAEVSLARACKDGRLDVCFRNGFGIHVDPCEQFEAWEFVGNQQRVVSIAGGDLAVWL